ncbi:MAG: DUF5316 family protein [Clostridiaceae bacterium]
MKKAFFIGIIIAILGIILGIISKNALLTQKACGIFSVACLIVVGVLKVAFKGGKNNIGRFSSEMKKRVALRRKVSDYLVAILTPNAITAIVMYIIFG